MLQLKILIQIQRDNLRKGYFVSNKIKRSLFRNKKASN